VRMWGWGLGVGGLPCTSITPCLSYETWLDVKGNAAASLVMRKSYVMFSRLLSHAAYTMYLYKV